MQMPGDEFWVDPTDGAIDAAARQILAFGGPVDRAIATGLGSGVEAIAWVDDPDSLPDPKLAFLLRHWNSLRGADGAIPDRHRVDVLDLVPAIGSLMMLEAERDGLDAVYRVYGTAVASSAGRDWTGYRVSEMNRVTKPPASLMYRACYRAVHLRPAPLFTEHASPPYLGIGRWRRLILPLADGPARCARYLVGSIATDKRPLSEAEQADVERRARRG